MAKDIYDVRKGEICKKGFVMTQFQLIKDLNNKGSKGKSKLEKMNKLIRSIDGLKSVSIENNVITTVFE